MKAPKFLRRWLRSLGTVPSGGERMTYLTADGRLLSGSGVSQIDIAKRTDRNYDLHTLARGGSGVQIANNDGDKTRNIARYLVDNNPHAQTTVDVLARKIVGKNGIYPIFSSKDAELNRDLGVRFQLWARRCNISRRMSYAKFQNISVAELATGGEAFSYRGQKNGQFFIEGFEPEQLYAHAPKSLSPGEQFARGVVYDSDGAPLRYLISQVDTGMLGNQYPGVEPFELPADRVYHVHDPRRFSDYRGISNFRTTALAVHDLAMNNQNELGTQRSLRSALAALKPGESSQDSLSGLVDAADDETGKRRLELGADIEVLQLDHGDEMQFMDVNRPGNTFVPFQSWNLKTVAASWGIPYQLLSGDHTGLNYTVSRSTMIEAIERFACIQDHLVTHCFSDHVHDWLVSEILRDASLASRLRAAGETAESLVFLNTDWTFPETPLLDIVKESQGDAQLIAFGLACWSDVQRKRGRNPRQVLLKWANEQEMVDQVNRETGANLSIPTFGNVPQLGDVQNADVVDLEGRIEAIETQGAAQ